MTVQKPRVLLVHTDLEGGGPQRVIRRLALSAGRGRFRIGLCYSTIHHLPPRPELLTQLEDAGVALFEIPGRHPLTDPRYLLGLRQACRRFRPDVVNLHCASMAVVGALVARFSRRAKLLYSDHTPFDAELRRWEKPWMHWALGRALRRIDHTVVVAPLAAQVLADTYAVPPEWVSVIAPGIELPEQQQIAQARAQTRRQLGLSNDLLVIGSIGMMEERKGFHDLIRSFAELKDKLPMACLLLFGDGLDRGAFVALADTLGIGDRVTFTGYWHGSAVEALSALDIYAHPSYMEAMPASLIEAAACRLPIVATRVGGNELVVEPGNGRIIAPGDTGALTEAILAIAELSHDERLEMGLRSRELASQLTADNMVRQYEMLWSQMMND